MDYETYREARKQQKNRIRYGFMVWPSNGIFGVKDKNGAIIPVQSKGTLVGKVPAVKFEEYDTERVSEESRRVGGFSLG